MSKFCSDCGKPVSETSKYCPNCGAKTSVPDSPGEKESIQVALKELPHGVHEEKSPFLAVLCSFFIPGLGQVYDGETARGLLIFLGSLIGFFIYIIPGVIVWIFGMYDAYSIAKKMNKKEIPFKPTKTAHLILFIILAIIIAAIVFILVALAALSMILHGYT